MSLVRQFDTCRLLPSRFAGQEDSVLTQLSDSIDHLKDLFDLDNATNQRLAAEHGGLPGIGIDELVFGVPDFRIVNAAYTYPRPEGSRFNSGQRGAWYCAFDIDTALAEIVFHKTVEYSEINYFNDSVSYQVFLADFTGQFHDIRHNSDFADCLDPQSYIASQELAEHLLITGSMGLVYPSVRHTGGINLVSFRPALVGNVRRGKAYQLTWAGLPEPSIKISSRPPSVLRRPKG